MVEFALILPLLMVFLLGIVTAGTAINSDIKLNQALRDSARYGSRLDPNNYTTYDRGTWVANVVSLAQQRYTALTSGGTVCVAAVVGQADGSLVVYRPSTGSVGATAAGTASSPFKTGGDGNATTPCWVPSGTAGIVAGHIYVQIIGTLPARLQYFFGTQTVTLRSKIMMPAEWNQH